jgi:hypothetical protein
MNVRSLSWKLNWYRQSELEGALLLGKMVRAVDDGELVVALVRHCADEARHACLWAEAVAQLGLPFVRIHRSYQSFYGQHGAAPGSISEALALTHVFEKRVWRQFHRDLACHGLPPPVTACLRTMLDDERQHLDWIRRWLSDRSDGEELLERFARIDDRVYALLEPFEDRLWDLPGLGEEPIGRGDRVLPAVP